MRAVDVLQVPGNGVVLKAQVEVLYFTALKVHVFDEMGVPHLLDNVKLNQGPDGVSGTMKSYHV